MFPFLVIFACYVDTGINTFKLAYICKCLMSIDTGIIHVYIVATHFDSARTKLHELSTMLFDK